MRNILRAASVAAAVAWSAAGGGAIAGGREAIRLDGTWDFATDPNEAGEARGWFRPGASLPAMPRPGYAPHARGKIAVPGAWDAQGYGTESDKVRHNFVGKGWYRRRVRVPARWRGRRVFLRVGGVHRAAKVWVNARCLGEHVGYLSAFEFDVTPHVRPGDEAVIAIQVDSKQRRDVDALTGCADLIDYVHVSWGGIWGHVTLEARGRAWLDELFIQPKVTPAGCTVSAALRGDARRVDAVRLEVQDGSGRRVARTAAALDKARGPDGRLQLPAAIPDAKLWSPESPCLYTARLSLLSDEEVIDSVAGRFGLREVRIRGPRLLLNGRRLLLRGYGDDHIYPRHMALPTDKDLHLRRLRTIRSYGFNHVRHHSTIMPPEYYDACDEVGMLVTAEFPIAYLSYFRRAKGAALETYRREWAAAITRHRNHPSILDWCMGNEFRQALPLAGDFRRIARRLDPTRPFVDTDGTFLGADRDTLDFHFVQFDVARIPLDRPEKFRFDKPGKPVVSHETGNYLTFPRLDAIRLFRHNIKPYWLAPCEARLRQLGLLEENALWARNSERLYLLCHKLNLEALRKNPYMSGYHWWLFQDYWTTSNGIVDWYFRPKSIGPEQVLRINNDVVVLEDGLGLTCRGGAPIRTKLLVSNYSPGELKGAALSWRATAGDRVLGAGELAVGNVPQGGIAEAGTVEVAPADPDRPTKVTIEAELLAGSRRFRNDWSTWVYPARIRPLKPGMALFAGRGAPAALKPFGARAIPRGALDANAVYVADSLDRGVLDAVQKGARLVLLGGAGALPADRTTFKTAWWKGSRRDNNCGTVVYDHPITRAMAPEGWCDAGWYHLLQGAEVFTLDDLPKRPDVIIRSIPVLHLVADRALLWEARLGKGSILVSGLNHRAAAGRPEGEWLLARMIEHVSRGPQPRAALPANTLTAHLPPPGPYLSGFRRLVRNEGEAGTWHSYRQDNVRQATCRQTQRGHVIEWETAPPPRGAQPGRVTFVFAGGLGWKTQPRTRGFSFLVNGKDVLRFDLADRYISPWKSGDGKVELRFVVKRRLGPDDLGVFYATVSRGLLPAGKPCRLGVRSLGTGSRRWFGLHPYTDVHDAPGRR